MSLPVPSHLEQATAAFRQHCQQVGIDPTSGLEALRLAASYYHSTTHVSRTDQLRGERNRIQDELERVSGDLLRERRKVAAGERRIAQLEAEPKAHQRKAYKARKCLREISDCVNDEVMRPDTKVRRIKVLVAQGLASSLLPDETENIE